MNITAYAIAERYIGMKEILGKDDNPAILSMLQLDNTWPEHDEVPWCSGFVNHCAWLLRLPRSKSLMARSWLSVGTPVKLSDARQGFDVVILSRGGGDQPPATVLDAPGHVGFFSSRHYTSPCGMVDGSSEVFLLGGNQGNSVSVRGYDASRILGVRRLWRGGCEEPAA